jgi:hypothetical protein
VAKLTPLPLCVVSNRISRGLLRTPITEFALQFATLAGALTLLSQRQLIEDEVRPSALNPLTLPRLKVDSAGWCRKFTRPSHRAAADH